MKAMSPARSPSRASHVVNRFSARRRRPIVRRCSRTCGSEFDLHYSFFQLKDIDWTAIGAKYRPLALAAKSDAEFALVVSNMLAELHDPHVSLTPFGAGSTMRYVSPYDTAAMYLQRARRRWASYVTAPSVTNGGHIRYGRVGTDVGYAVIESFLGDGWAGEMDEVLERAEGRELDGHRRAQQQRRQSNAGDRHRRPIHRSLTHLRLHPHSQRNRARRFHRLSSRPTSFRAVRDSSPDPSTC